MHNRALNRRRLKPQIRRHEFNPAALPPFPDGEWSALAEL